MKVSNRPKEDHKMPNKKMGMLIRISHKLTNCNKKTCILFELHFFTVSIMKIIILVNKENKAVAW